MIITFGWFWWNFPEWMVSLIVISLFSSASPEDYKAEIQSANKTSFIVRLAEGAPYILSWSLFHSDFHFFFKSFLSIVFLLTFCLVGRWGTMYFHSIFYFVFLWRFISLSFLTSFLTSLLVLQRGLAPYISLHRIIYRRAGGQKPNLYKAETNMFPSLNKIDPNIKSFYQASYF